MKITIAMSSVAPVELALRLRRSRHATSHCALFGVLASLAAACASPTSFTPAATDGDAATANGPGSDAAAAPTYDELFATYFDKGTPGHCATAGCHADPAHNVWLCMTRDDCYQGMVEVGLIDPADPTHSEIADPKRSPLTWVNPAGGTMPFDAPGENEAGRAAIQAWVAAGAAND